MSIDRRPLEGIDGLEPSPSAWKADALPVELHPRVPRLFRPGGWALAGDLRCYRPASRRNATPYRSVNRRANSATPGDLAGAAWRRPLWPFLALRPTLDLLSGLWTLRCAAGAYFRPPAKEWMRGYDPPTTRVLDGGRTRGLDVGNVALYPTELLAPVPISYFSAGLTPLLWLFLGGTSLRETRESPTSSTGIR